MLRRAVDLFDLTGTEFSLVRRDFFIASLLDTYYKLVPVEKIKRGLLRIVGPKDRSEVSGDRSAPRADVFFADGLAVLLLDKAFEEHQRRGVVKVLGIYPAPEAPR